MKLGALLYDTDLIFLIEQLQLVIDKAVLCALLFSQRPLLLQLWTPEGLYAMHTGAQFLIRQFQLLFEVSQFPLKIRVLGLELAEEEGGWFPPIVVLFRRGRGCVRAVIVALEGLVAERPCPCAVVCAGGGGAPALVGRRRGLVIAREVGAPSRGTAVHLGQAAARAGARPLLPAPVVPARRPLLLSRVLA